MTIAPAPAYQALDDLPDAEPVLSYRDVSERVGLTVGALRVRVHAGTMPPPDLRIGVRAMWFTSTIDAWAPNGVAPSQPRGRKPKAAA